MAKRKLLVLISGSGTNLQALIDACAAGQLDAEIVRVVSNKKAARGLTRAADAGIPTSYHNLLRYKKADEEAHGGRLDVERARASYDADLAQLVMTVGGEEARPDLVVCAGWMHILAPSFLAPLDKAGIPVINLHPALPNAYDGINAIGRAYDDFVAGRITYTGLMIHYVIAAVDKGRPIVVRRVELREGEALPALEERFHAQEHVAIVDGTRKALTALPGLADEVTEW